MTSGIIPYELRVRNPTGGDAPATQYPIEPGVAGSSAFTVWQFSGFAECDGRYCDIELRNASVAKTATSAGADRGLVAILDLSEFEGTGLISAHAAESFANSLDEIIAEYEASLEWQVRVVDI